MNEHDQIIADLEVLRLTNQHLEEELRLVSEQRDLLVSEVERMFDALKSMAEWIGPPPADRYSFDNIREDAWKKWMEINRLRDLESQKGQL